MLTDVIVLLLVAMAVIGVIKSIRKQKKSGSCGGCCGSCSGCSGCGSVHYDTAPKDHTQRKPDRKHQGFQSRDQQGDGKARYGAVAVKKDSNCSAVCIIQQGSADLEEWAVMDDESSSGRFPALLFPQWLVCAN